MPNMQRQASQGRHNGKQRGPDNVVSLCERRRAATPRIVRLSPEYDGIELLYANDRPQDKLLALRVLAGAMPDSGEVAAMVPWLKPVVRPPELRDPLNGRWVGYRLPDSQYLFTDAPE